MVGQSSMAGAWRRMQRVPWLRMSGELVIIVASILIAFSIDAWWSYRADRERETFYVQSLLRDMSTTEERLRHQIEFHQALLSKAERLLSTLPVTADRTAADSTLLWLSGVVAQNSLVPSNATYDEMVATGGLRVLRDGGLRVALAEYRGLLAEYGKIEESAELHWQSELLPFINRRVAVVDLFGRRTHSPDAMRRMQLLLADAELRNQVAARYMFASDIVGSAEQLAEHLSRTKAILVEDTARARVQHEQVH